MVVLLVGIFFWWQGKKATAPMMEQSQSVATTTEQTPSDTGKSMVASIKDAMGLGKTMQCTYAGDGDTTTSSTVVVAGQKFKSTTVTKDKTVYALFDGENQYTWMSDSKQGMKMSKACLDKMKDTVKSMTPTEQSAAPQDVSKTFDVAKNVACETAPSVDLTVPTDITFTDQCAMMEKSLQMMQEVKDKLPKGITIPNIPTGGPQPY